MEYKKLELGGKIYIHNISMDTQNGIADFCFYSSNKTPYTNLQNFLEDQKKYFITGNVVYGSGYIFYSIEINLSSNQVKFLAPGRAVTFNGLNCSDTVMEL